jgi:peptidoglycan hydrolase-like protein with peptidoglycan-binding domain
VKRALLSTLAAAALLPAAGASASLPPLPGAGTTPAPPHHAAGGKLYLSLAHAIRAGHLRLALTRRDVVLEGAVRPYVAHQSVTVKVRRGSRVIRVAHLPIKPSRTHRVGLFSLRFDSASRGHLRIDVVHASSRDQKRFAGTARLIAYTPYLSAGARGPLVAVMQRQLDGEGYSVSRSGTYNGRTARAALAFRKVNGFARVGSMDRRVIQMLLANRGAFHARYPSHGRHVEAELSRQVMAELYGGTVHAVYVVSSGKPSTPTVLGSFHFYRKQPGTNAKGMVDSSYFIGGYAIHGYHSVPTYPASHGCLRVPIPDARPIYDWVRIGDRIDVYP